MGARISDAGTRSVGTEGFLYGTILLTIILKTVTRSVLEMSLVAYDPILWDSWWGRIYRSSPCLHVCRSLFGNTPLSEFCLYQALHMVTDPHVLQDIESFLAQFFLL
jgi:hypothetical protein